MRTTTRRDYQRLIYHRGIARLKTHEGTVGEREDVHLDVVDREGVGVVIEREVIYLEAVGVMVEREDMHLEFGDGVLEKVGRP